MLSSMSDSFFFQAEDGIRVLVRSRGLGDVYKRQILATGALERHFAFGNNDRPGVMSASASRTSLNRFGVVSGQPIVIATTKDSAYRSAHHHNHQGTPVHLFDSRTTVP